MVGCRQRGLLFLTEPTADPGEFHRASIQFGINTVPYNCCSKDSCPVVMGYLVYKKFEGIIQQYV
jgi:hypothetical protein